MQLPEDFIKQTEPLFKAGLWHDYVSAFDDRPPVSIRLNPLKVTGMGVSESLCAGGVPWCTDGIYLTDRPNFTFDPLLHAGLYYVQEASSMFLDRVLRRYVSDGPVKMLDLCAAPGGKSTVARAALPAGSLLVSNEPIRSRAQILAENIMKYGHPDVIVTNNYARDITRSKLMFDVVVADVPCSGEGMFRKDEGAVSEWSVANVEKCWRLQREIITDIWPCLHDGGLLVYSTCTFNTKENEENVRFICDELGAESLPVDIDDKWMITGSLLNGFSEPVYRFIPGRTCGEGLFMAVLRKHGSRQSEPARGKDKKSKRIRNEKSSAVLKADCLQWITTADDYRQVVSDTSVSLIPKLWSADYDLAAAGLNIMTAGVHAGEIKGRDVNPTQALALSSVLRLDAFPAVELDYASAIDYLRREAMAMPEGTPRGHVLVTYKKHPLGFVKNIGNRANNLYPAEWKIRSGHTPEGINRVIEWILVK